MLDYEFEDGSYIFFAAGLTPAFLPLELAMGDEGGCAAGRSVPCLAGVTCSSGS